MIYSQFPNGQIGASRLLYGVFIKGDNCRCLGTTACIADNKLAMDTGLAM